MKLRTTTHLAMLLVILSAGCGQSDLSPTQPYLDNVPLTPGSAQLDIANISLQPTSVRPGQTVLLNATVNPAEATGVAYSWKATGGTFGDAKVNPASWTAPAADGNYVLTVDASNQDGTARGYVSVVVSVSAPPLLVTTISPAEVKTGDIVTIHGSGFGATQAGSTVNFAAIAATEIISWTDTQIAARVPSEATSGEVTVTVGGNTSNIASLVVLWPTKSPENVAVTALTSEQRAPAIIQDGSGGALLFWEDRRNGNADIFAQRVSVNGVRKWASDGVTINGSAGEQVSPKAVSDGANGAIVVWEDHRSGNVDIYAQRVDASGNLLWDVAGIPLSTAADSQLAPQIVSDGAGGAIVVWEDHRNGNGDIYAQRIDADGVVQWATNGVPVSATAEHQFNPRAATDGAGGVFIVWEDFRSGTDYDIYGQRLDAAGVAAWTSDGIVVSNAQHNQLLPEIVTDGTGAIIAWEDYRSTGSDIYAQRVNAAGMMSWAANGVVATAAPNNQRYPRLVSDDANGAFVTWEDYRSGNADIYAQHLTDTGGRHWAANGTVVALGSAAQTSARLVSDHSGGIIVAFLAQGTIDKDVHAQRISSSGAVLWSTDGIAVTNASGDQSSLDIVEDRSDGAVVVWVDGRSPIPSVFTQGVSASGRQ